MNYLIYVSQAERPMTSEELAGILEQSRAYNHKDGMTGLLIYKDDAEERRAYFMQVLEGEKPVLDATFKRIAADRRHHTKVILEEGKIDARNFPDWSMGFRNVEPGDFEAFDGYADLGSDAFWTRAQAGDLSGSLELMRSFYEG